MINAIYVKPLNFTISITIPQYLTSFQEKNHFIDVAFAFFFHFGTWILSHHCNQSMWWLELSFAHQRCNHKTFPITLQAQFFEVPEILLPWRIVEVEDDYWTSSCFPALSISFKTTKRGKPILAGSLSFVCQKGQKMREITRLGFNSISPQDLSFEKTFVWLGWLL